MLVLVNGMDVVKSTDLMGGNEYKGHTKNKGISLKSPRTLMDASSVNGMDAVNYKLLQNLTASKGYPLLFSNWMDAVNSLNPHGC